MDDILNKIKALDSEKMYEAINSFPLQIEESYDIMKNISIAKHKVTNVIICGMGGSAIGGNLCKTLIDFDIDVNIFINREYRLPNWATTSSLVLISSYSGNTEETISCYNECIKKKISPIVFTTGGYLFDEAKKNKHLYIKFSQGYQPRAAIGFSFSLIFLFLSRLDLINNKNLSNQIYSSIQLLKEFNVEMFSNNNIALDLASKIYNKYIVIYSSQILESISYRFRCQLAENSKIISSHFVFPEQNHNEIEGFSDNNTDFFIIIWIQDVDDHRQITKRIESTSSILSDYKNYFYKTKGRNIIERLYNTVLFFDWVSFYVSIFCKVDPTPVNKIKKLKELLSK